MWKTRRFWQKYFDIETISTAPETEPQVRKTVISTMNEEAKERYLFTVRSKKQHDYFVFRLKDLDQAVYSVCVFMKLVGPEFHARYKAEQNETRHADSHSENVDQRIGLLFFQISQSDQYVTF